MVRHRGNCVLVLPHTAPLLAYPAPLRQLIPVSLHQRYSMHWNLHPCVGWSWAKVLPGTTIGAGSSQLWRQGSSRPPSWLSYPSQPVLYLDIDNSNCSSNQPVIDSTGSTLFIYHLFWLESSVSLQSTGQATALGMCLSFFRGGQCSSVADSLAAAHPLPSTSKRQTGWFQPDDMGDLVLFSPNRDALRRINMSFLYPPSLPHCAIAATVRKGEQHPVFTSVYADCYVHTCVPLSVCFSKIGKSHAFSWCSP